MSSWSSIGAIAEMLVQLVQSLVDWCIWCNYNQCNGQTLLEKLMSDFKHFHERESRFLELKETIPQKKQMVKTCVAFANGAGGEIVIGVKDESLEILGVTEKVRDRIFEEIVNSIIDSISPQILPEVYEKNIDDKTVVFIKIFPGNSPPYFVKSEGTQKGVYLRAGSTTARASQEYIEDLFRQRKNTTFDQESTNIPVEELEKNLLTRVYGNNYTQDSLEVDKVAVRDTRDPGQLYATNAALLFFTKHPEKFIDESIVICTKFKGNNGRSIIQTMDISGPIPHLVETTLNLLNSWLERDFTIAKDGRMRGQTVIPMEALREGIINALVHRKYFLPGAIKIALYENRLEIFSPGSLPGLLTVNNLGDGTTFLRNPLIAKFARKHRLIEKLGSGVRLILQSCEDSRLRTPEFVEGSDFVKLTFFLERKLDGDLTDREKIIQLGEEFGEIKIKDLMERLHISRNTATRRINVLIEEKMFERVGKGAGIYFRFKGISE